MDKATLERVNQPVPFAEFPKMKHHPDGRERIVASEREESELGADWLPSPDAAAKVKADRDAAAEKRLADQIARVAEGDEPDPDDEAGDTAAPARGRGRR